jgi:hypothetical protein
MSFGRTTPGPYRCRTNRDGMRFGCRLEAVVRGRGGAFVGETVNVSRSGVLVRLQESRSGEFQPRSCFRTGADVSFVDAELKVRADLARVADGDSGALLLAFRFRSNLDPLRCRSIGIEDRDDGAPTF